MRYLWILRALAYLRRLTVAAETLAMDSRERMIMERAALERELGKRYRQGTKVKTEIGKFSVDEANAQWRRDMEERGETVPSDEDDFI